MPNLIFLFVRNIFFNIMPCQLRGKAASKTRAREAYRIALRKPTVPLSLLSSFAKLYAE